MPELITKYLEAITGLGIKMITEETRAQWREEFEKLSGHLTQLECYLAAKEADYAEKEKLQNRNDQLEGFCKEWVYGEENPDYYETMNSKIKKLNDEIEKLRSQRSKELRFWENKIEPGYKAEIKKRDELIKKIIDAGPFNWKRLDDLLPEARAMIKGDEK